MSYNLDDEAPEYFDFILGGHNYRMRYPTTAEALAGKVVKDGQEGLKWLCSFIDKLDDKAPGIYDALQKITVKRLQAFNAMVAKEFGTEE